jgi:hypothetical protein
MIVPTYTPYASPVLLVKKKGGSDSVCVDYRELNSLTRMDIYPLPIIDCLLQKMTRFRYFSKLDLRSAYHLIRMSPESEDYTAFICTFGTF